MASLDQVANVNISLNTASVGKASFGIPLVVSPLLAFTDRTRKYDDYSSAMADGLDDQTLLSVKAVFSQSPRPKMVIVGRRDVSFININVSDPVASGTAYSITVNSKSYSYTAKDTELATDVLQGLGNAIQNDTSTKTLFNAVSVLDGELILSPIAGSKLSVKSASGTKTSFAGSDDLASDLQSIKDEDNTWYGWSLTELNDNLILSGAQWTETQDKLFFARTASSSVWSSASDDVASKLKDKQYLRTVLIADKYAEDQAIDAAVMGRFFTKDPGATVFALKNLPSMTVSKFSDTEKSYLIDKNVNTYQQYSSDTYLFGIGANLKVSGRVSSGEFIDVVRDRDWLINDIQTAIAGLMIRNDKIPYTNAGIALIVNTLRARLQNAQTQGVIAPDQQDSAGKTVSGFTIIYPNAADVDADIRAARILYITFNALLAGAIQLVNITGTLSYSDEV